jgi:ABC-type transport system involved in multi-copper enzyme maturation permease subunit
LVFKEIERKTIYLVLTKPISRETFYIGKFLGLCLTILVAGAIMTAMFIAVLSIKTDTVPTAAYFAAGAIILEAWLLTAVSLLFSSFTSPLSSAIYTFGVTLIGHGSATIWLLSQKATPFLRAILEGVYYLFPNLEKFNLRNDVVFNLTPDFSQVGFILLYFAGYTIFLLILGVAVFRKDEF